MQTTSSRFAERALGNMRKLAYRVLFSFDKTFDDDIDFFTIGESLIGGTDFIPGSGSVVQEWDKYRYRDFSDRVIAIEWQREDEKPSSAIMAMADVVLDNHDNLFTPNFTTPGTPTTVQHTFGKTTNGGSSTGSSADRKKVSVATPSDSGTLKRLKTRLSLSSAGSTNVRGVIYADNAGAPGALLATGDEVTINNTTEAEITMPFSGAQQIAITAGVPYWIGFHQQDPGVPSVNISRDNTAGGSQTNTDTYSDGPSNPFGVPTAESGPIDCYAEFEETVEEATPSELGQYILPSRPIRIYAGFGDEPIPVFVGLTEGMPTINEKDKTVSFHCVDVLKFLFGKSLESAVTLQDMRVDQILGELFELVGLTALQYDFDEAFTVVPFFYAEADQKLGPVVKRLVEADMGSLYITEQGILRYRNRQNFDTDTKYVFDKGRTLEIQTRRKDDIINVVEVRANVRVLDVPQIVHTLGEVFVIQGGQTLEKWFNYDDPVINIEAPVFEANTAEDRSGLNVTGDIEITDQDDFSKASKITFRNNGATDAYIVSLTISAEPAKTTKKIFVREEDSDSVDRYEESILRIENEFIQDDSTARSLALFVLRQFSTFGAIYEAEVKGSPALQLNDAVSFNVDNASGQYTIDRMACSIANNKFTQILGTRTRIPVDYFTIALSLIGGDDVIAP